MKNFILIIVLSATVSTAIAQQSCSNTNSDTVPEKNRYGLWLLPSTATNINGIAIGPIGSESLCQYPYTKRTHGINLQLIGGGIMQTFYVNMIKFHHFKITDSNFDTSSFPKAAIHNGLLLSPFGTYTDQINGATFSLWMSSGVDVNGISFDLLWGRYYKVNGVSVDAVNHTAISNGLQIGLINKTHKLRGVQVGLWNKNNKRSLPLINWSFRKSENSQ